MSPEQERQLIDAVAHAREVFELERDRLKDQIAFLRERTDTAAITAQRALEKALEANEKRLDALNELRQLATDQATKYATREMVEALEKNLEDKSGAQYALVDTRLKNLELKGGLEEGKAKGANWVIGLIVSGTILLLATLTLLVKVLTGK